MTHFKLYDCPNWDHYGDDSQYERGKLLIDMVTSQDVVNCPLITFNEQTIVVHITIFNIKEDCVEIWVRGKIKID